jgi:hypothetical protein
VLPLGTDGLPESATGHRPAFTYVLILSKLTSLVSNGAKDSTLRHLQLDAPLGLASFDLVHAPHSSAIPMSFTAMSRLQRSFVQLLLAAGFASASLPSLAGPGMGIDGLGSVPGTLGSVKLFRLDGQGLQPLPDLAKLIAALPSAAPTASPSPRTGEEAAAALQEAQEPISDAVVSELGGVEDGAWIAQRPVPPRPVPPPAPVVPTPAPIPGPPPATPLISSATWTVVVVAGVAVAVLVATSGPTPPVSR